MKIIKEAQDKSLEATKNSIIKASELYVVRNLDKFALAEGEKTYIQLSELEDGYIKKIKGSNGKLCEGYVKVEKTSDDFEYIVYLDCGNGDNLLVDSSYVNYGGNYLDEFRDVIKTKDGGYVAVGRSNSTEFGGNKRYGNNLNYDAIIVKYDNNGLEEWSHNFGGSNNDQFISVIDDGGSYVVVGSSSSQDKDMIGLDPSSFDNSILVKYNYSGKIVDKKIVTKSLTNTGSEARKILYKDEYYYVMGHSRNVLASSMRMQYIVKYDSNFNEIYKKAYGGTRSSSIFSSIFDSNNNLVIVGGSSSTDEELVDIKIGPYGDSDATIFVINKDTGNVLSKGIFGGTNGTDNFYDVVEVEDGYIALGTSLSTDYDMEGLSKGNEDIIAVKFGKEDLNGIQPILWKRVIGGSNVDFLSKGLLSYDELTLIGYSNSTDGDLSGLNKGNGSYYDGLIIKMDLNGNIISKKTYGGSKSDYLYSGIYENNKYILVGGSFSTDIDIESFNLGNRDAIMISLNDILKPINNFKLETLLMSKQKELIVNYGTSIPQPINNDNLKLYTTNDVSNDLGEWCTTNSFFDPNGNYNNVQCLKPFDTGKIVTLYKGTINANNDINIVSPSSDNNWLYVNLYFSNVNSPLSPMVDNLKIKFHNNDYVTIEEAVGLGYVEPLVLIGNSNAGNRFFSNTFNIISGRSSGIGSYPSAQILIKPKNKLIEKISFKSGGEYTLSQASITIQEYLNFDISLTPNN